MTNHNVLGSRTLATAIALSGSLALGGCQAGVLSPKYNPEPRCTGVALQPDTASGLYDIVPELSKSFVDAGNVLSFISPVRNGVAQLPLDLTQGQLGAGFDAINPADWPEPVALTMYDFQNLPAGSDLSNGIPAGTARVTCPTVTLTQLAR